MLAASTFPGEFRVSETYWMLSCSSAVVFVGGARWPVAAALVLSALAVPMFAAEAWGLSGLVPYLGALAVADVAARSDRDRIIATVAACWVTALLLGNWLDDHTTFVSAATAVTIVAGVGLPILLGLYLRGQKRMAEFRRASTEFAVRAEERAAMARELHDLVAHHMASIVLRVGVAEHVLDEVDSRVAAVLRDVHGTAADALTDVRRFQDALRDPAATQVAMVDPEAVWTEIDAAVERTRAAGFAVSAQVDRDALGLDAIARLTLLRVTQEALTNVMKHADRTGPVELNIGRREHGVAVRVSSTIGPESRPKVDGHGIAGMTERLSLAGGRLDVRQTPNVWEIDAWLPKTTDTVTDPHR
ncbi:MAG: two-component sensor histidine kinase [Mycolicibacterium sp.]|nr:two-component sensor histidine kinase [Mycolicibacterium sp.]